MGEQARRLITFIYFSTSASVPLCLVDSLLVQGSGVQGFKGYFNREPLNREPFTSAFYSAGFSSRIYGVMNISTSSIPLVLPLLLKSQPSPGISFK